jgi:hypothetical protein
VLGLIATKTGRVETVDELHRIDEEALPPLEASPSARNAVSHPSPAVSQRRAMARST